MDNKQEATSEFYLDKRKREIEILLKSDRPLFQTRKTLKQLLCGYRPQLNRQKRIGLNRRRERQVSDYWQYHGKTLDDRRANGRTFVCSSGAVMCNECCHGDRCDDVSHYNRDNCPYCMGSGYPLQTEPERASTAQTRNKSCK